MRVFARVLCGVVFAAFIAGHANAALINFPLNNPGEGGSYSRMVPGSEEFTDHFSLTLGNTLGVFASVSDTTLPSCSGACGFDNLMLGLFANESSTTALAGGVGFLSLTAALLTAGTYDLRVIGTALADGARYTVEVGADVAGDPVGEMPIPGAAFLLGSGLLVLFGASRKKAKGDSVTSA